MKKVITILIIVLLITGGVYFGFFRKVSLEADITGIETPNITMPFESGVDDLELNNFDIGAILPSNLFPNIYFDMQFGSVGEIGLPSVSGDSSSGTPPANWEPDEATCNQFKSAPSCSFVPEEYRDLCQKCKN